MTVRSGCHLVLIAAILVLPAALAQADDRPTLIPIFSDSDGNRACIEVSRSGEREIAVPVLEVPGKTVRQLSTADETGSGLPASPAGGEGEGGKGQVDVGKFLGAPKRKVAIPMSEITFEPLNSKIMIIAEVTKTELQHAKAIP